MRKLVIGIVAAGTLMAAAPASAQIIFDAPGVDVRIGSDRDRYYGDRYDSYDYGYDNDRADWYGRDRRDECQIVTIRERMPNGTIVERQRKQC